MDKGKAISDLQILTPGKYSDNVTIMPGNSTEFALELVSYSVSEEWSQPMSVGQAEEKEEAVLITVTARMKAVPPVPEEEVDVAATDAGREDGLPV